MKRRMPERGLVLSGGGARGAYQAGVLRWLTEKNWQPELVCGTSIGAINAAAVGSGMDAEAVIRLWLDISREKVFRVPLSRRLRSRLAGRRYQPLVDTAPLRAFLETNLSFEKIRQASPEIIITAVHIASSRLRFFSSEEIGVEHVLASSAIPVLFPWQKIDGEHYWDGGVMANTPILPALKRKCSDIIVVLMSPVGGGMTALPRTRQQALELMVEQSLLGSFQTMLTGYAWAKQAAALKKGSGFLDRLEAMALEKFFAADTRIRVVAPRRMLGLKSMLNFSAAQAEGLVREGYEDARDQLGRFP